MHSRLFFSSSRQPLLPRYEHELSTFIDREAGSASMARSSVRDAWIGSTSLHHARATRIALQRKEKHLEAELQALLDAQGAGLVAGLSMGSSVDPAAHESRTYTTAGMGQGRTASDSGRPTNQLGLGEARLGILTAMRELTLVKDEEATGLRARAAESQAILNQVNEWTRKREGLESEIRDIESSPETALLQKLQGEERGIQV